MDRERVAEECLRIEKHHGDVLSYLRGLGCVSPWGTWFRIQKEQLGRKACQITNGKGVDALGKSKLTLADKKEAVRIATEGGNPYNFLREKGIGFPESTWAKIKKGITDPDVLAKIPKKLPDSVVEKKPEVPEIPEAAPAKVETPEEPLPFEDDPAEEPEMYDPFEPVEPQEPEKPMAVTAPLMYMGRKVTAVENEDFGEFHRKGDWIDWETKDGDIVCMTIADWRVFFHAVPDDFKILGVSL